jgi:hypothetical protein
VIINMNEQDFVALGLDKEAAKKCAGKSAEELTALKAAQKTELDAVRTQVTERDSQISELKKFSGTADELKKKVEALQGENKAKSAEYEKALLTERKKNAVRSALLSDESRPHDVDMVVQMLDLDKVSVDETGKIVSGFREQDENLRKEKSFLFADGKGAFTPHGGTPPEGGSPEARAHAKGGDKTKLGRYFLQQWKDENGIVDDSAKK